MVEPEAKPDLLAPVAASEVKPAMRVFDGTRHSAKTHSLHQPHLLHPPAHHVGTFHHLDRSQTTVGPGHHAEMVATLQAEVERTREELTEVKQQLVASETGKAQALREFTNIKNLLDQISLVEHFAASDDVEVETAPLPPNWSDGSSHGQLDTATHKEIDRLRNELEASRNLSSKFAAELDRAKQEIDEVHRMETSRLQSEPEAGRDHQGSICLELENARKDIRTLQATLSDAWSHQGTCALELARAKEEISWLEADLEATQNLTVELTRAKDDITLLQGDLEIAQRLQASALITNSALQADLEELRILHETSTTELRNAKQTVLDLRADYETEISESRDAKRDAKEEIRRLQGELAAALTNGRDSAKMLRVTEAEMEEVEKKLEAVVGQYYNTCTELSDATGQVETLRGELESLRVKYESCSSELFNVKEDVFRLEVEHLASHEDLMTDITIAQEENLKLQAEVASLKDDKISLSVELEAAGKRYNSACSELFSARKDIARLQSELSALEGQHRGCLTELETLKDVSTSFQIELTQVQELHDIFMAELNEEIRTLQLASTQDLERSLVVVRGLKEETADLSLQYSAFTVEKSLTEKKTNELASELLATNARLREANAAQTKAEAELLLITATIQEIEAACTDLETVRAELATVREANSRLTLEKEDLRAQITATALASEMSDTLQTELDAIKESEASSEAQIEDLKAHLYAVRDSEAKAKESVVSTSADLQKVKLELAIAKEALEWVGGDAAALAAELEAKNAEVASTKEGEARAKAAFTDYSLKLQRMRLDLEDATKLADKVPIKNSPHIQTQARAFELNLDEATAKLEKVTESERTMSASMASLKAELNNAKTELAATREDHGLALTEKEQQYELELNQMRTQCEVAVMAEAEEASFAVGQATREADKARQEVQELQARIETLETKLEMLQLEVEAAKASEEWAFAQMRLKTIPEGDMETEEGVVSKAPVSFVEYQSLKTKAKELQELVNKRVAVGVAEANAAKASEKEMQQRIQRLEKELRCSRDELSEAISKREEAEAAKFSCEAALRAKRLDSRKSLSHSGHLNNDDGHPKLGDRQGSLNNGICNFEGDSPSSSPSRSSLSFASFASPGRSERSPGEQSGIVAQVGMPSEESKQRKVKFSSKIGAYFSKKKILL